MGIINSFKKLTKFEFYLWMISILSILLSFIITKSNPLVLSSSLVGVTGLIFLAKGLPSGQLLTILFGVLYALVSYQFRYYGEMITYLGMTLPSAIITLVIWIKNPHLEGEPEVRVSKLNKRSLMFIIFTSVLLTILFYFMLKLLNTPNLLVSTVSIFTSLLASLFMIFRVPYYALAYAANDVVLIILWILASIVNINYFPMIVCFLIFLFNDLYAFKNWKQLKKFQSQSIIVQIE